MNSYLKSAAVAGLALAIVGFNTGTAKAVVVNCGGPNASIQDAVDKANGPTTIFVKGLCVEDPTITVDDVTLQGHTTGGTVDGTITIDGAKRVVIDDLTVTGSGTGIRGTGGASFTVQNSNLSNNMGSGIGVFQGASAIITNNSIDNNGSGDETDFSEGIDVIGGANALITDNVITHSFFTGVFVARNASARFAGNTIDSNGLDTGDCGIDVARSSAVKLIGGNTISNGGFAAICVEDASAFRQGDFTVDGVPFPGEIPDSILQGDGDEAIFVGENAIADLRNANITGLIDVFVLSTFNVHNSSIDGDIDASGNSAVQVGHHVDFNGTLNCDDNSFSYGHAQCGQTCTGLDGGELQCTDP